MTSRPTPLPDDLSGQFWDAARDRLLKVQRCDACSRYHHPPVPFCLDCASTALTFTEVSGRGRVVSYTETRSGARHEFFRDAPYIVALIEIEEQPGVLMYSNLPGATLDEIVVGAEVQVEFETVDDLSVLPQFRLLPSESRSAT